jgi:putative spermidine/putrescine transport system permease protein
MQESRLARIGLRLATGVVLLFVYVPLLVIVLYAFNESRVQAWPIAQYSLKWFAQAAGDDSVRQAFVNSVLAGLGATGVALVLGTMAALAVQRFDFFGRETITFLVVLPIALPGVVTGVALSNSFHTLGISFGLSTIIVGHATFCVVIAYNNVLARLRRMSRSFEEASADLGADTWQTFRHVSLPAMRTALLAGGLLAFALSFDEVIVTNFTAGPGIDTIPLWIFSAIQRPNLLPVVNVVATFLILLSVVPVYFAQRIGGGAATSVTR